MQTFSLSQLNALVKEAIEVELADEFWVQAEISEAREVSGHCYMDLIEKDDRHNTPIARAQARCWRNTWILVKPHFESVTKQKLKPGMKVLLRVYPQFHELYGFSWIITDIDPTFTIGDMARKRMEIVRILKEEGVFDLNKQLSLPLFCQRIAVISSAGAAGYGDFAHQLSNNEFGLAFHTELFPAAMQGEQVENSVISALNAINERCDEFDCVVIIRGGGGTSDLSGFDTLALAENVANFPLPIITGIGHERDESVLDMVSHTTVKTPTAAATLVIDSLHKVLLFVKNAEERIISAVRMRIDTEKLKIQRLPSRISLAVQQRLSHEDRHLLTLSQRFVPAIERRMTMEKHKLEMLSQRANALDPITLLKRGYSITMLNGHIVRDPQQLDSGQEITTLLKEGEVTSIVK